MRARAFGTVEPFYYRDHVVGDVLFSHERYRGLYAEAHTHAEIQMQVPLRGRMHVQVESGDHLVGPEVGLIVPPGLPHSAHYLDGEVDLLNVMVPAGWFAGLARRVYGFDPSPEALHVVTDPFLWPLGRMLTECLDTQGPEMDAVLASGLELLGHSLARTMKEGAAHQPQQDPRILRALDHIIRHHADDVRVLDLATEAMMTPRHFDRCFKQAVGLSPKQFLIETRVNVARNLLEDTAMSVLEVGLEVGFHHPSHFIRIFQRVTGRTPAVYRQERRSPAARTAPR